MAIDLCREVLPCDIAPILFDKEDSVADLAVYNINYWLDRTNAIFRTRGGTKNENDVETIDWKRAEYQLQTHAFGALAEHKGKVHFLVGNLGGKKDEQYKPTEFLFANPALDWSGSLKIGKDCVLVNNDRLRIGLLPLIRKYGSLLAHNEISMYIAEINSRMMSVLLAGTDNDKKAADAFFDDLKKGQIKAIMSNDLFKKISSIPLSGKTSAMTDLIEMEQYLTASLWNAIGLDANYNMKREAINSQEAQLGRSALLPFVDNMYDCRKEAYDEANKMFAGLDGFEPIVVEYDSAWEDKQLEQGEDPDEEKNATEGLTECQNEEKKEDDNNVNAD